MTPRVVSVSLLSTYIRQLFESDELLSDVWIEGEVSETFVSRAGHVYFTLRDEESKIKSVLFRSAALRQRLLPAAGDKIAAHGYVSTYERDGVYQLYVDVIERAGQGLLALQFEQLRQKLEAEGLFDATRKRELPALPRVVGVVTSAEGAVWHDIQTVLRRRYPLAHLILSPAPVQGAKAPVELIAALERLQQDGRADVIIVARGGGSVEDLAVFNDERLARAIFACRIPVISAIGHETDWTIVDWVADVRAATPSAAAELCAPSIDSLLDEVRMARDDGSSIVDTQLRSFRVELAHIERALDDHTPRQLMRRYSNEIKLLSSVIQLSCGSTIEPLKRRVEYDRTLLQSAMASTRSSKRVDAEMQTAILGALDPRKVIDRGYAVLENDWSGSLVSGITDIVVGDLLTAHVAGGDFKTQVQSVDVTQGVGHNG